MRITYSLSTPDILELLGYRGVAAKANDVSESCIKYQLVYPKEGRAIDIGKDDVIVVTINV